jgi:hypothetical protein
MTKTCTKCSFVGKKLLFCKTRNICLICYNKYAKQYRLENIEARRKYDKQYNLEHKDIKKQYNLEHKEHRKQYELENKETLQEYQKQYRLDNKETLQEYYKQRYSENRTIINEQQKQYNLEHKEQKNQWRRTKSKTNPSFRLRDNISGSIRRKLKSIGLTKNNNSCMELVSFVSIDILREYLEALFSHSDNLTPDSKVWMNWQNHSKYNPKTWDDHDPATWTWQLDHIMPQSLFDFSDPEQIRKCWALSNLRPLSSKQNTLDGALRIRHQIMK